MIQLHEVLQLTRPLIGVDLETTGVDTKTAGVVELALEIMVPGQPVKEYRTLVNPLMAIPEAATKVHGITNAMVKDAPTFKMLSRNLLVGFENADFVGYSLSMFDLPMLREEFARAGVVWSYETAKVIDAFRLWQVLEQRTLSHAVEHWLGIKTSEHVALGPESGSDHRDEAHSALWDIKMSTRVAAAQLIANPHLPRTVDELHAVCWPDRFDADGKFRWRDGELTITFGEHRGKPLRKVPTSYLKWICGKDFSALVKETCRNAAHGIFPTPPPNLVKDDAEEIAD